MRKIREMLRLRYEEGMSARKIARSQSVSHSTILELLHRFEASKWNWPLPEETDDSRLEEALYPPPVQTEPRDEVDLEWVHRELRKKNVTLALLWEEYLQSHTKPYSYSRFCEIYREWASSREATAPQIHKAGEKVFVDYAGPTVPIVDASGDDQEAQIFVAVLGASNYTYVEACKSQDVGSFIQAVCNALEYFGGVPEVIVPDNLKAAVIKPSRFEAELQSSFEQVAEHYRLVVLPARPRRPKDKSPVEKGVQDIENRILGKIRNRVFFDFNELNEVLWELLEEWNDRPFQKMEGSRRSHFESIDQPVLRPLPKERFVLAKWTVAKLHPNCHVQVDRSFYSAPYQLIGKQLDVRLTDHMVDIFHKGTYVASHARKFQRGSYATQEQHLPPNHRAVRGWNPGFFAHWGETIGPQTKALIEGILASKAHPEQAYRSCRGVMDLAKRYSPERLEAAAARAVAYQAFAYKSVHSILEKGLDRVQAEQAKVIPLQVHENLRGPKYYEQ